MNELRKQFEKETGKELPTIDNTDWTHLDADLCNYYKSLSEWLESKLLAKEPKTSEILNDLLNEQEQIISSPIRFDGVHIEKIKQVFAKHGIDYKSEF